MEERTWLLIAFLTMIAFFVLGIIIGQSALGVTCPACPACPACPECPGYCCEETPDDGSPMPDPDKGEVMGGAGGGNMIRLLQVPPDNPGIDGGVERDDMMVANGLYSFKLLKKYPEIGGDWCFVVVQESPAGTELGQSGVLCPYEDYPNGIPLNHDF